MTKKEKMIVNDAERILRSLEDGFLRADKDGFIIMANEAIAELCGYSSPEDMIGLHMKKLYADPAARDQMVKKIKQKGKLINYELELLRKDGTRFWSLNNIKIFCDEKGNLLGTEGVIRNITTVKQTENELQAVNQQLAANEQQLRAANQQLQAANQQLSAGEEELRAANQQLSATEQQLRAANQQLEAANQQLTASEKDLKAKTQLLNDTGEMARVGGWEVDPDTQTLTWSEETYRIHEVPMDQEPPIKEAVNFFHPDDRPKLQKALQNAAEKGEPYDLTLRFITAKGKHLITRTICRPEIKNGKVIKLRGTFQDVTDREKAEEAHRKSDERFRIAQDMSPDGFTILHPIRDEKSHVVDFSWVYENEAVAKMNGTDPEQVVGKRLLDLFPGHRDTNFLKAYKQVAETGKPITFEEGYQGETIKDQTWFRIVVVPMSENIAILAQDITERKLAEEELQAANQQLSAGEEELRAANQQLSAIEQQLRASNQQLEASNQQLQANEQQLRASEEELRAANQQLTANEIELKKQLEKSERQRKANLILLKDNTRNTRKLLTEIEQREKTQKQLKESQEKYRVLAENAKHIIITHDLDGKITYANQFTLDFMQLTKDQIIGENVGKFVNTKEDIAAMRQRQQDFLSGKDVVHNYEIEVKTSSGEPRIMEAYGNTILKNDKIDSVLIVAYDITERKKAEQKILNLQELFKRTEKIGKIGGWEFDVETMTQTWTEETFRIMEIDTTHGEPKVPQGIDFIEQPYRDMAEKALQDAIQKGKGYIQEWLITTAKGNKKWVHSAAKVIKRKGKVISITGSFQDITKRKQAELKIKESEEKFRSLFNRVADAIFIYDPDTFEILEANEATSKMYGYKRDELTRMSVLKFSAEVEKSKLAATNIEHKGEVDVKFRHHKKKDGSDLFVELQGYKIVVNNKPMTFAVCHDITEAVKSEQELIEAKEKAEESKNNLRFLFDNMAQGVVYHKPTGEVIQANEAAAKILGLSFDQLYGKTSFDPRWKSIHEDGTTYPGETHPAMVTINTKKPIWNSIMGVFIPEKNAYSWININSIPQFNDENELIQVAVTFEDITEIRNAKERAKDSEKKYRSLFTSMQEGVYLHKIIYDQNSNPINYKIIDANPITEKYLNIKPENAIGKTATELFQVEDAPFLDIYAKVAESSEPYMFEQYFPPLQKYFLISVFSPQKGEFATVFQDITNRKQAEEELRASEERFQKMLSVVPDMISIQDPQMNILYSNWQGFAEVPKNRQNTNTKCYNTYRNFDNICPDCQAKSVMESRKPIHKTLQLPDGKWFDVRVIPILDKNSNVEMFMEWVRDITNRKQAEEALKQSEQKYRSLVSTTSEGFWMIDNKSNTIDVNKALCKMLEYEEKEMIGRSIFDFVEGENIEIFRKQVKDSETKKQRYYEIVLSSKSGKKIPAIFNTTSQFDENGKRVGSFAFITDITKRKKAEKLIEKSLREKETLLRELYHRTKNNMQVISSMLSLQTRSTENEMLKTAYKDINSKIKSMALVHKKLYESQDLSNLNLKEYISDLIALIWQANSIQVKNIEFKYEVEEIMANLDMVIPLGLAINELISNAIKHAFPNDRNGNLSLKLYKTRDKYINLEIEDDGAGIGKDLDLRQSKSMGLQIFFNLIEYQLRGKVEYKTENGLKWSIKIKDELFKNRV
ncbi:MAG: PAS domain S-box protein [Candidatus Cloacimonetes bacterium]|nr:PAS domain S-box protein [Candidatus Cloacimonadota bacterium]